MSAVCLSALALNLPVCLWYCVMLTDCNVSESVSISVTYSFPVELISNAQVYTQEQEMLRLQFVSFKLKRLRHEQHVSTKMFVVTWWARGALSEFGAETSLTPRVWKWNKQTWIFRSLRRCDDDHEPRKQREKRTDWRSELNTHFFKSMQEPWGRARIHSFISALWSELSLFLISCLKVRRTPPPWQKSSSTHTAEEDIYSVSNGITLPHTDNHLLMQRGPAGRKEVGKLSQCSRFKEGTFSQSLTPPTA